MAFEGLSSRLQEITRKIRGKARITESDLKENQMVSDVTFHNEGRILNFIITVSGDMKKDDAKALGEVVLEKIKDKDKEYYDIQVLIDSEEESDVYPIIGYKHKTEDAFDYGSEVESGE